MTNHAPCKFNKITMDLYGYLMPGLQDIVAEIFDKEAEQSVVKTSTAG